MRSFRRATTNLISEIAIQSHSDVQSRLVLHEKREIVTFTVICTLDHSCH